MASLNGSKDPRPFPVNILIPMAGEGSRFRKNGFVRPKPFIDVAGKPMISWVLDNVKSNLISPKFIIVIRTEHDAEYNIAKHLRELIPDVEIVYAKALTEGAACTTLLAKDYIDNDDPLFIINSDQFLEWDADKFWSQMIEEKKQGKDGNVLCFKIPMEENDIKWSYAKINDEGHITDIQEKVVISEHATVGAYYWTRGKDYVNCAEDMIKKDIRVNGEFYVAPVYNESIAVGGKFTVSHCDKMWGLGVPQDLVEFLHGYVRPRRLEFLKNSIGVDGAIPTANHTETIVKPRLIAHRGNLHGINRTDENKPSYITSALEAGYDVEIDVWWINDKWMLGHDEPQYEVAYDFLLQKGLWIHAKHGPALAKLTADSRINCFFHNVDDFTLTSKGWMWIYPDKPLLGDRSIAVMFTHPEKLVMEPIYAICADNVAELKRLQDLEILKRRHSVQPEKEDDSLVFAFQRLAMPSFSSKIKLIIFDLDGVLVESKDLHYEALNKALEIVAGPEFIIHRAEHELIYDGLPTNTKLNIVTKQKNLDLKLHKPVWTKKQEETLKLFEKAVRPDPQVCATLKILKESGFPIAVASNCIRASVEALLRGIGALPYIDAFFSNEDPEEIIVIEDNVKGFEAATRAGANLLPVANPSQVSKDQLLPRIVELISNKIDPILNIVIPIARSGQQYWLDGPEQVPFDVPLYLSDVNNKCLLDWTIKSTTPKNHRVHFIFLVRETHAKRFHLHSLLPRLTKFQKTTVIPVRTERLGALSTTMLARGLIDNDNPLLICDGGHFVRWARTEDDPKDIVLDSALLSPTLTRKSKSRGISPVPSPTASPSKSSMRFVDTVEAFLELGESCDGAIAVQHSSDPRFSYVEMDNANGLVRNVQEKVAISNSACIGMLFWKRGSDFVKSADLTMADDKNRVRNQFYLAPTYNAAIQQLGAKVVAAFVPGTWSLRSGPEIVQFRKEIFGYIGETTMNAIYTEMRQRNLKLIASKGITNDAVLLEPIDTRRCWAVYTLCDEDRNFHPKPQLSTILTKILAVLGDTDAVIYSALGSSFKAKHPGVLHFTFLQLIGFNMTSLVDLPQDYAEVVESILANYLGKFEIRFTALAMTRGNVVIQGYPSIDINDVRHTLRRELSRIGYPLFEPYLSDMAHMTLVRFSSPLSPELVERLSRICEDSQLVRQELATLTVDGMSFGKASWKMLDSELTEVSKYVSLVQI